MKRGLSLVPQVLERLTLLTEPWLSCDACFEQVDAQVEALLTRHLPLHEGFRAHLRGCPACREETATLLELLAMDCGIEPAVAVARLDADIDTSGPTA
jgi:hypothetical protein